jgi:uncharacterized protein YcnI
MSRLLARLGIVVATAVALALGVSPAAGAHVTVHADDAAQGGFAELAFRVPTESDTASTVKVQLAFPVDTPIADVSVLPHPGWTYQVTRSTAAVRDPHGHGHAAELAKAVSQIEWTASGRDSAVKPGEYELFRISAGPLPDTDRLVFKVVQTYDDGQQARWIELPVAGGPQPEHPAPVLSLTAAAPDQVTGVQPVALASAGAPMWWTTGAAGLALLAALGAILLSLRSFERRSFGRRSFERMPFEAGGGDVTAS